MKSKTLETLLARESGLHSDMVTRFQKLRDSRLLGRSRGRNAEILATDEIVSGILSMVAEKPGFAAMTTIGLRNLKPVGVAEDAFAEAPTLAAALTATLEDETLRKSLVEVYLGDSDREKGMATSAAIYYRGPAGLAVSQYVPATALSHFHKGAEIGFDRHSLFSSVTRETVVTARVFDRIAREYHRAREYEALMERMMP